MEGSGGGERGKRREGEKDGKRKRQGERSTEEKDTFQTPWAGDILRQRIMTIPDRRGLGGRERKRRKRGRERLTNVREGDSVSLADGKEAIEEVGHELQGALGGVG